jgi:adenylyl cyclase-associated protein
MEFVMLYYVTICCAFGPNLSRAQSQFLTVASQSKAPSSQSDIMKLLEPTSAQIIAVMEFFEKNRGSPHFNHLNAVSASISALSWVTVVSVLCLL